MLLLLLLLLLGLLDTISIFDQVWIYLHDSPSSFIIDGELRLDPAPRRECDHPAGLLCLRGDGGGQVAVRYQGEQRASEEEGSFSSSMARAGARQRRKERPPPRLFSEAAAAAAAAADGNSPSPSVLASAAAAAARGRRRGRRRPGARGSRGRR